MAGGEAVDLYAPITSDRVLEVRSSKMKLMPGLTIESGIDKTMLSGPVKVGPNGIEGDEHDYTFHGGPDKAVHAYCCSHYPTWQAEFPSAAERFTPGGFGENLVVSRLNERNVCIGDIMSIGEEVVLQVSLPRQPCFKLNHRFQLKNFAPNTWKTSRTGWYYRVLKEGTIRAGDEIRLVERKHPQWTIERIQEYLHRNRNVAAMNEELAAIEEFGAECKGDFQRRVAKAKAQEKKSQEKEHEWRDFRVVEKTRQTPRITSFVIEATKPLPDPEPLSEGAHAKLKLGNGLIRAYSIVSGTRDRLEFGIALDDHSRGGSSYLHEMVNVGDVLQVGRLTNGVPVVNMASNHIFVAGGVGITAFLALIEGATAINWSTKLHYAVRSAEETPFKDRLQKLGDHVVIYDKSKGERLDIRNIIRTMPWNSALYFCGPGRLMDEALRETRSAGLNPSEVHFEAFAADTSGDPFEAVVANKDVTVTVGEEETLLEVLQRKFGDDIPSSCEVGNCGTCKIALKDGRVEHRGTALLPDEQGEWMLSCVSRGVGRITVEV